VGVPKTSEHFEEAACASFKATAIKSQAADWQAGGLSGVKALVGDCLA